jgi:hypothetical protein
MKVKYTEGSDALTITACGVIAERDKPVEVPAEIGKQLINQGWVEVSPAKKETK